MRVESEARQAKTRETGWEGTPGHCDGDGDDDCDSDGDDDGDDDGGECGDDDGDDESDDDGDGDGDVIFHQIHSRRLPS